MASTAAVQAMAQAPATRIADATATEEDEARWQPVLCLPCEFVVELAFLEFKVARFLELRAGSVIATGWRVTRDVPLRVNGTLIGWGEFAGSGDRLAVRVTELA